MKPPHAAEQLMIYFLSLSARWYSLCFLFGPHSRNVSKTWWIQITHISLHAGSRNIIFKENIVLSARHDVGLMVPEKSVNAGHCVRAKIQISAIEWAFQEGKKWQVISRMRQSFNQKIESIKNRLIRCGKVLPITTFSRDGENPQWSVPCHKEPFPWSLKLSRIPILALSKTWTANTRHSDSLTLGSVCLPVPYVTFIGN